MRFVLTELGKMCLFVSALFFVAWVLLPFFERLNHLRNPLPHIEQLWADDYDPQKNLCLLRQKCD